ncbi:MAG: glycosyltransferase family 2 protein [Anaerohalosphaeraceae bacterium]|nr:glycosyltransferase family 2 protein [Anaerohalosphaeraceae bacterium]
MDNNPIKSLSVFFPCYNESANIETLITKALVVIEPLGIDFELIIIDDGSSDGMGELAERLAEQNDKIRVIHHEKNYGYGTALQSGFKACQKEYIFYTDGDGQFDMGELPGLMPYMADYDIVSCYRIKRQDSIIRKLNAFCWTCLVSLLFRLKLRDIDCAFKLYKRSVFDDMPLLSTGAMIDTEVLARAKRKGCKIYQTGVQHYRRTAGQQTGANLKVILRAFKELFVLHKRIRNGK